ncbi:hypothetical protein Ddye_027354 [Dipteronia dyeriana]|uniref:START domain-containing protein n=1 Tax=Dipteronia dyeriana TaxID=168575 RepID=A0AAD9TPV0_9ROSI|nr:hypothetical protein Ddye_027354 [Dipteronia dyeriana]
MVVEGLNVLIQKVVNLGLIEGERFDDDKVHIYHLQFADDTILFVKLRLDYHPNAKRVLRCFELASGLKINFHKSGVVHVGIGRAEESEYWAKLFKCKKAILPITYLGFPSGGPYGIGGVLRDANGKLCFANPNLRDHDIAVISDSKVAVSWVNNDEIENVAHVNSIYEIRSCMRYGCSIEVVYESRVFNSFTDSLAKMGFSKTGDFMEWGDLVKTLASFMLVTWVEHAAAIGTVPVHNIYRHLVVSGFAFGAKRWASSLIRHCQWIDTLRDPGLSATTREDEIMLPSGRENLLKLSERMRRIFWGNFDASSGKIWMSLPIIGAEDIRVMIKGNIHFRDKPATKLAFTTSIRLPVPHRTLFSFLCDGFAILPDNSSRDGACGSLLTMAFNIIDDHESTEDYMPRETMIMIYNIINKTAFLIRNALVLDNEQDNLNDQDGDPEIDLNNEVRAVEKFFEGVPNLVDENGMEPEVNFEDSNNVVQYEEDIVSSSVSTVNESSPDLLESRASPTNVRNTTSPLMHRASDLLMAVSMSADTNKTKIKDLASAAMEELTIMAVMGEPLWLRRGGDNIQPENLNSFEYMRQFGSVDATLEEIIRMVKVRDPNLPSLDPNSHELPVPGGDNYRPPTMPWELEEQQSLEASRHLGFVHTTSVSIVELFMDVNQWLATFSNIVSRATLLGVISTGVEGSYDGALQVLRAEFYLPTALVPARESYFARYCKKLDPMTWGVVDVSLEDLFCHSSVKFRRRASGCLIQQTFKGSNVTWVEHAAVNGTVIHSIYRHLVVSGFAFGAQRWVASLIRHCQWLGTLRAAGTSASQVNAIIPRRGRKNLLKLSERMRRIFWGDFGASSGNIWMSLPIIGAEDIRVMTKRNINFPGKPPATMLAFTTSLRLPVPPITVFNFLRDDISRIEWDVRLSRNLIQELAYIINGGLTENRVSILHVNATPLDIEMMYLQESFINHTDAYVIYAPIDVPTMSSILNGRNIDDVNILPCGFAILPDDDDDMPVVFSGGGSGDGVCDSLLTMAFNIIDDQVSMEDYISPESMNMIYKIINKTAFLIRNALVPNNVQDNLDGV